MILKISSISDLHFNLHHPHTIYRELVNVFFKTLKAFKPDIIFINGDIFDQRVTLNTNTAMYANRFIHELIHLKGCEKTYICIIHGTYSHDYNQLKSFSHYENSRFRLYHESTIENIKGLKVLFLPEEYGRGDHYKEYSRDSPFDFCIGHGTIGFLNFVRHFNKKSQSTIFDPQFFIKNVKGLTLFGHEHKHTRHKNIRYVGSFSRHNHGEEEPKGFLNIQYDTQRKCVVSEEFIKNTEAPIYKTLVAHELPSTPDECIDELNKKCDSCDYVRILIYRHKVPQNILQIIMGCFQTHDNVSIKHVKKIAVSPNVSHEHTKKLDQIQNKSWMEVTIEEIKRRHNIVLTPNDITSLLE